MPVELNVLGWDLRAFDEDEHVILSLNLFVYGCLLVITLIFQFIVGHAWKSLYLPEAAVTMIVGLIFSTILRLNGEFLPDLMNFNSSLFFFAILPPILFNSGYHLRRKLFFANVGGILGLSIFGTLLSSVIVSVGIYMISNYFNLSIKLR